jgi:anaerobic magnesium-protoporphyrin IX monomethyl ester cyclase
MKILLSHAYFLCEDPKEHEIMRPYPPLGILYISAWLKQHGFDCTVFDSTFSDPATLRQHLLQEKPDVLALYANLMTRKNLVEMLRFVRRQPELDHTKVVLGGPEVTHHQAEFLRAGANALVVGEGEETLLDWVRCLAAGKTQSTDWQGIPGLSFRNEKGEVEIGPEREKLKDLDLLPMPDRAAINLNLYLDAWKSRHGSNAISISTMRGCPYTCKWCSRAVYGLSYRRRSPKKVVEEMDWIRKHYPVDSLWFVDDVFTVSHKWLDGFVEELDKAGFRIPFECITRADRLNEAVLDQLKAAGCFRVWIGAESGSQAVIDAMDRRVKVEQVREMIRQARRKGIQAGTFIMLGYPGETEADIAETITHLAESQPDVYTITLAYPIKGTELFDEVKDRLVHVPDWATSSDRDVKFERTYSPAYYKRALSWVHNEVAWRKYRSNGKALSPKGLKSKVKSILAFGLMRWERSQ